MVAYMIFNPLYRGKSVTGLPSSFTPENNFVCDPLQSSRPTTLFSWNLQGLLGQAYFHSDSLPSTGSMLYIKHY
jgi:hypothetical protein